jgi:hypothetical protein
VDASPDTAPWNPAAQVPAVQFLVEAGADQSAAGERAQQRETIPTLLRHGARPTDEGKAGKSGLKSAASKWIIELLEET